MNITCAFFGTLFIIVGILFSLGKLHVYLNVWKKMPPEEKEKIRIDGLCHNIGGMIVLCGLLFLLGCVFNIVFTWSMIVWLVLAGLDVWYISKSNRYSE